MARFLLRLVLSGLAVLAAAAIFPDRIRVDSIQSALVFALVLGVLNALVKPVLVLLTCPLTVLTLGLFILVVNALVFWLAAWLASILPVGIWVNGFEGAFLGALSVSIVNLVASRFDRREE